MKSSKCKYYNDLDTIEIRLLYYTIDSITVRVIPDKQKVTAVPRIGSLYRVPPQSL